MADKTKVRISFEIEIPGCHPDWDALHFFNQSNRRNSRDFKLESPIVTTKIKPKIDHRARARYAFIKFISKIFGDYFYTRFSDWQKMSIEVYPKALAKATRYARYQQILGSITMEGQTITLKDKECAYLYNNEKGEFQSFDLSDPKSIEEIRKYFFTKLDPTGTPPVDLAEYSTYLEEAKGE